MSCFTNSNTIALSLTSGNLLQADAIVSPDGDNVLVATANGLKVPLPSITIPPGLVALWAGAGAAAPTGWLLTNGAAVSRTTYASLFNKIGTRFGNGDGATTFNLPSWQSSGDFVYQEWTGHITTANAANGEGAPLAFVTCPSITADGATQVFVEAYAPLVQASGGTNDVGVNLWLDGVDQGRMVYHPSASNGSVLVASTYLTPSNGSRTFSLRAWAGVNSQIDIWAASGGAGQYRPGYLRVTTKPYNIIKT